MLSEFQRQNYIVNALKDLFLHRLQNQLGTMASALIFKHGNQEIRLKQPRTPRKWLQYISFADRVKVSQRIMLCHCAIHYVFITYLVCFVHFSIFPPHNIIWISTIKKKQKKTGINIMTNLKAVFHLHKISHWFFAWCTYWFINCSSTSWQICESIVS